MYELISNCSLINMFILLSYHLDFVSDFFIFLTQLTNYTNFVFNNVKHIFILYFELCNRNVNFCILKYNLE